jgi:hypothetical protein
MTSATSLPHDLRKTVQGDLAAFARLLEQSHDIVRSHRAQLTDLTFTGSAVLHVLQMLQHGEASPEFVQRWASFMRRGYIASTGNGPIAPIDIDFEATREQAIADALARLDELGDVVDGEIDDGELGAMMERLMDQQPDLDFG